MAQVSAPQTEQTVMTDFCDRWDVVQTEQVQWMPMMVEEDSRVTSCLLFWLGKAATKCQNTSFHPLQNCTTYLHTIILSPCVLVVCTAIQLDQSSHQTNWSGGSKKVSSSERGDALSLELVVDVANGNVSNEIGVCHPRAKDQKLQGQFKNYLHRL